MTRNDIGQYDPKKLKFKIIYMQENCLRVTVTKVILFTCFLCRLFQLKVKGELKPKIKQFFST